MRPAVVRRYWSWALVSSLLLMVSACVAVVLSTPAVAAPRGAGGRTLDLTIVDATSSNHLPAGMRVVVGKSAPWLTQFTGQQAKKRFAGAARAGKYLDVAPQVPEPIMLSQLAPPKLPAGPVEAILTITDRTVVLEVFGSPLLVFRVDPYVTEARRVGVLLKPLDDLGSQADAAHTAIFGDDDKALQTEIEPGIRDNVMPKLQDGLKILHGVTSTDPRVQEWITLRTRCWSLWAQVLYMEQMNQRTDIGTVTSSYADACNSSVAKRKQIYQETSVSELATT